MLKLNEQDKGRLQRLNKDTDTVEALKKLVIVSFFKRKTSDQTSTLAAQRIALDMLAEFFKELSRINPDNTQARENENPV